jgi:hypothetical protein
MSFQLNRRFRKKYRQIFRKDPLAANLFLLLCELAGPDGKVILPADPRAIDRELASLMQARFEDQEGWQL